MKMPLEDNTTPRANRHFLPGHIWNLPLPIARLKFASDQPLRYGSGIEKVLQKSYTSHLKADFVAATKTKTE
jgi:hypothetical protein